MTNHTPYPELIVIDLDALLSRKEEEKPVDYDAIAFGDMPHLPPEALIHFAWASQMERQERRAA